MALSEKQLAALERNQYAPGESGNSGGRPKSKPLTDAMRLFLAGDEAEYMKVPQPTRTQVEAWYRDSLECPKSRALLLDRVEGSLPKASEQKELPRIAFTMQPIRRHSLPAGPISESPREGTSLPSGDPSVSRAKPEVVEVEAVPIDDDDADEDE